MAMGRRKREEQGAFWIASGDLPQSGGHPFYVQVNKILDAAGFDGFVEKRCRAFYADKMGRPSLPPAMYVRMLLIGYFEGIDSERGIAWRLSDSLALRRFLGYALTDVTADHSTISRTRPLLRHLAQRADLLTQVYPEDRELEAASALTALVTTLAMNFGRHGKYTP